MPDTANATAEGIATPEETFELKGEIVTVGGTKVIYGQPGAERRHLPEPIEKACKDFLDEGERFAQAFAESLNLSDREAASFEGKVLASCQQIVLAARIAAFDSLDK